MKSITDYFWLNTEKERDYINITDKVKEIVRISEIKEGLCLVNARHITASVYTNFQFLI